MFKVDTKNCKGCGGTLSKYYDTSKCEYVLKCGVVTQKLIEIKNGKSKQLMWVSTKKTPCDWIERIKNNHENTFKFKDTKKDLTVKYNVTKEDNNIKNRLSSLITCILYSPTSLNESELDIICSTQMLIKKRQPGEDMQSFIKRIYSKPLINRRYRRQTLMHLAHDAKEFVNSKSYKLNEIKQKDSTYCIYDEDYITEEKSDSNNDDDDDDENVEEGNKSDEDHEMSDNFFSDEDEDDNDDDDDDVSDIED